MTTLSFSGPSPAAEKATTQSHTFLSLAPTTSASYPISKAIPKSPVQEPTLPAAETTSAAAVVDVNVIVPELAKTRRSSSLSSDGSGSVGKRRFLKLGPVHGGLGMGEGEGDWSEDVIV